MQTLTEENYLKAIYKLSRSNANEASSTNSIANELTTKAASVTDMLKKLAEKKLINYVKYHGVSLTEKGRLIAIKILRRHRLWEYFLVEKLSFSWDEVHDVAEELEHVNSDLLTDRLDDFLGHPKFDPHGDPIPDKDGNITQRSGIQLSALAVGESGKVIGVRDSSSEFLSYLNEIDIALGIEIKILNKIDFDNSLMIEYNNQKINISHQIAKNIYLK